VFENETIMNILSLSIGLEKNIFLRRSFPQKYPEYSGSAGNKGQLQKKQQKGVFSLWQNS
jgi:hypothetical protein